LDFVRGVQEDAALAGFRFGDRGTHTSRTMMLAELSAALSSASPDAARVDYAAAIVDANCLGKPTLATRRLSSQRLGELYALDPGTAVFRILRRLWQIDEAGRPLLALLAALARDPLLRASAPAIVDLPAGGELQRDALRRAIRTAVRGRLNDATLDKVARNTASTWAQSGHLTGRTFKRRLLVLPTPAAVAFALWLAQTAGFRGEQLLTSPWVAVLDCSPSNARGEALEAKRLGLIDLRAAGDVLELGFDRLDPALARI
jgi:hypothetical protein